MTSKVSVTSVESHPLMVWTALLADPTATGEAVLAAELDVSRELRVRHAVTWRAIALFAAARIQSNPAVVAAFGRSDGQPMSIRVDLIGEVITTGADGLNIAPSSVSFGELTLDQNFSRFVTDTWRSGRPVAIASDKQVSDRGAKPALAQDFPAVSLVLAVAAAKSVVLLEFLIDMIWVDAYEKNEASLEAGQEYDDNDDDSEVAIVDADLVAWAESNAAEKADAREGAIDEAAANAAAVAVTDACLPMLRWLVAATGADETMTKMVAASIQQATESEGLWSNGTDDRWEVVELPADLHLGPIHRKWVGPDDLRVR